MPTPAWLERTELLVGKPNIKLLQSKHVLIVGLGGVGAYAAEMIARAGVGTLTIADSDIVQSSNINRQLIALHSTIGQRKTNLISQRLHDINPDLKLHVFDDYVKGPAIYELLSTPYDYVVDAIDTLSPKIYLNYHAKQKGFNIVSSMGAGGKFDPTQIKVADISETNTCRLAFDIRKRLRRLGITEGIKAVFSTEHVDAKTIVPIEEMNKKSMIGTISYLPAVFGCTCASVVVKDLIDKQ